MTSSETEPKSPSALTCPICVQLFSEPVSLPCGHVYCCGCIQNMGRGVDQHRCPECQAAYQGNDAIMKRSNMCSNNAAAAGCEVVSERDACDESDKNMEEDSGCRKKDVQIGGQLHGRSTSTVGLDEPKRKLAWQVTELTQKLAMVEVVLTNNMEREVKVTTANTKQRETAASFLKQMTDLSQRYSVDVMQLIDQELSPGESAVRSRVRRASELTNQLRQAVLRAEFLLTESDENVFTADLLSLQTHIAELMEETVGDEENPVECKMSPARACSRLEHMNAELRERLATIQRCLRCTFNPSELTFDPETAHPNLTLSEDLKTVTFSVTKQSYPSSPQRFTSFLQVLSAQSFFEGDHCWEVELDGSPWIIGFCYSRELERSGIPSALESSQSSWCLMWFNNLLTAFERGQDVPLKRTTVSSRMEIRLSFNTHRLSFFHISPSSGKTHVYTFKANLTEPVHFAYRMMSGHPKARATICP